MRIKGTSVAMFRMFVLSDFLMHPFRRQLSFACLALVATIGGCATGSKWNSPTSWFSSSKAPPGTALVQQAGPPRPAGGSSTFGANSKLGQGPAPKSWWAAATAPFTKTPELPGPSDDPLKLDTKARPSPQIYVHMAKGHEATGDFAGAIKQYQVALGMDPKNLDAMIGLARMYDRVGDIPQASEAYARAARQHPQQAIVHNDLGMFHARNKRLPEAQAALAQAIKLDPTSKLYRNNMATILVELNRPAEALAELKLAHAPAAAHYNLGFLLHHQGDNQEAAAQFAEALRIDPSMEPARLMSAKLAGSIPQPPNFQQMQQQGDAFVQRQAEEIEAARRKILEGNPSSAAPVERNYAEQWQGETGPVGQPEQPPETTNEGGFLDETPLLLPPVN